MPKSGARRTVETLCAQLRVKLTTLQNWLGLCLLTGVMIS